MAKAFPDFATQYGEWLNSRLKASVHNGATELSTPILDPMNDGMRVYIEPRNGGYYLHDDGLTLENLSLHGIDLRGSEKRSGFADSIVKSSGVTIHSDRIETTANEGNLPQRVHFLLMAMVRINDLWLTTRSAPQGLDFFERVCAFLDEKGVRYSVNLSIPGRTVEHPIDIVVPLTRRRERFIKLIGTPSVNTAKVVSFSWIEIEQVRPTSERVILLNDQLQDENGGGRSVSDQTVSILKGYSTGIYRWSERNEPSFSSLWEAA